MNSQLSASGMNYLLIHFSRVYDLLCCTLSLESYLLSSKKHYFDLLKTYQKIIRLSNISYEEE